MEIIGKCLSLEEFQAYARSYSYGSIKPSSIVVHHTWSPKKHEWKGAKTLGGVQRYYESKGWNAGPHLFVAEDGIWLFTPMKDVGIHAAEGNSVYKFGRLKSYSLGIEVVGDYDLEKWSGETKKNALGVIKVLMDHLAIPTESLLFHRDFASAKKSCPGLAITKDWLAAELAKLGDSAGLPQPSSWAKEAWDWARELDLDRSVLPQQKVDAEWVFTMLKKVVDRGQV
jgi:N-acetylmuramoyl-L-alanine amidase CwlA